MKWKLADLLKKREAYTPKAKALLADKEKSKQLLANVDSKAADNKGKLMQIGSDLQVMIDILRDWRKGIYRQIPIKSILLITASFIYFLSPVDFIPDFLPAGLLDDVTLLAFTFKQIQLDVAAYREWKQENETKTIDAS